MGGVFEDAGQRTHLYRPSCLGQIRSHRSSHRCNLLAHEHSGRFHTRSEFHIPLLGDPQSSHSDLIGNTEGNTETCKTNLAVLLLIKKRTLFFFTFYKEVRGVQTDRNSHAQRFPEAHETISLSGG